MTATDLPGLLQQLKSYDEDVRKNAILGLLQARDPMAITLLHKLAVDDPSLEVRYFARKAGYALKELCHPSGAQKSEGLPGKSESPELAQQFLAPDPKVRFEALKRVLQQPTPETVHLVRQGLRKETHPELLGSFISALGRLGSGADLDLLGSFLPHPDPRIRANAVEALAGIGGSSAIAKLIPCLQDTDNRVLATTIKALQVYGNPELLKLLRAMSKSKQTALRDSAIFALEKFRNPLAVGILGDMTRNDPEGHLRGKAHQALLHLAEKGNRDAQNLLRKMFSPSVEPADRLRASADASPGTGAATTSADTAASAAATDSPTPREPAAEDFSRDLTQTLLQDLENPDVQKRLAALPKLAEILTPPLTAPLSAALERETDPFITSQLLAFLGRLKARDAVFAIEKRLQDPNDRIRANAIEAGMQADPELFRQRVVPLLQDANNRVKANAIIALARHPEFDPRPPLRELFEHPQPVFRKSGLYALVLLERNDLISLLERLTNDPDPEIQAAVHQTLRLFTRKGYPAAVELTRSLAPLSPGAGASGNQFASRFERSVQELDEGARQLSSEFSGEQMSREADQLFFEIGLGGEQSGYLPAKVKEGLDKTDLEISRLHRRIQKKQKKSHTDQVQGSLNDAIREGGLAKDLEQVIAQLETQKRHLLISGGRLIAENPRLLPEQVRTRLQPLLDKAETFLAGRQPGGPIDVEDALKTAFSEDEPARPPVFESVGLGLLLLLHLWLGWATWGTGLLIAFWPWIGLAVLPAVGVRGFRRRDLETAFWIDLPVFFMPIALGIAAAETGLPWIPPGHPFGAVVDGWGHLVLLALPLLIWRFAGLRQQPTLAWIGAPLAVYAASTFVGGLLRSLTFAQALSGLFFLPDLPGILAPGGLLINLLVPFVGAFCLGTLLFSPRTGSLHLLLRSAGFLLLLTEIFCLGVFLFNTHALPTALPRLWRPVSPPGPLITGISLPGTGEPEIRVGIKPSTDAASTATPGGPFYTLHLLPRPISPTSVSLGLFPRLPGSSRAMLHLDESAFQVTINGKAVPATFRPNAAEPECWHRPICLICIDTGILQNNPRLLWEFFARLETTVGEGLQIRLVPFGQQPLTDPRALFTPLPLATAPEPPYPVLPQAGDLFTAIDYCFSGLQREETRGGLILCLNQDTPADAVPSSLMYDRLRSQPEVRLAIVSLFPESPGEEKLKELAESGRGVYVAAFSEAAFRDGFERWTASIPCPWLVEIGRPLPPSPDDPLHLDFRQPESPLVASGPLLITADLTGRPDRVEIRLDDVPLRTLIRPSARSISHWEPGTADFSPGSHTLTIRATRTDGTATLATEATREIFLEHTLPFFSVLSPLPEERVSGEPQVRVASIAGAVTRWEILLDGKPVPGAIPTDRQAWTMSLPLVPAGSPARDGKARTATPVVARVARPDRHHLTVRAYGREGLISRRSLHFTMVPRHPVPQFVAPGQKSEVSGVVPVIFEVPFLPGQAGLRSISVGIGGQQYLTIEGEPWRGVLDLASAPTGLQTLTARAVDAEGGETVTTRDVFVTRPNFFVSIDGLFPGQMLQDFSICLLRVQNHSLAFLTSVEVFLDDRLLESFTDEPYEFIVSAEGLEPGKHEAKAVVRRSDGETTETSMPFYVGLPGQAEFPVFFPATPGSLTVSFNGLPVASFSCSPWNNRAMELFLVTAPAEHLRRQGFFPGVPKFVERLVEGMQPAERLVPWDSLRGFPARFGREQSREALSTLTSDQGREDFADRLLKALKERALHGSPTPFLLVLTDELTRREIDDPAFLEVFGKICQALESGGIRLFCLGLGSRLKRPHRDEERLLRLLAQNSGGAYWSASDDELLTGLSETVLSTLRGHSVLTFELPPQETGSSLCHLEITDQTVGIRRFQVPARRLAAR